MNKHCLRKFDNVVTETNSHLQKLPKSTKVPKIDENSSIPMDNMMSVPDCNVTTTLHL